MLGSHELKIKTPGPRAPLSDGVEDLERSVRSRFAVKQSFVLPDGEHEFQVAYDDTTKERFAELEAEVRPKGFRPELSGTKEETVLLLRKETGALPKGSRVPVLFALFTLASLVVFALYQRVNYEQLVPTMSGDSVFFTFVIGVGALIGAHEVGQRYMARGRTAGHAGSFAIPGVPLLPPFLPSLGFVSAQKSPALNRDALFDVVAAGPLAVLILAVVLAAVGDLTAVHSQVAYLWVNSTNSTYVSNPSAIEVALGYVLGPFMQSAPAGTLLVSPVADSAAVGFILVFIGLLPMAIYDGGLLVTAAWGERAARLTTYLSVVFLLMIDLNYILYFSLWIVVLVLAGRPARLKLLDEVSGLSTSRQWLFIGTLVLAFLCMPIPHTLATLPVS